MPSRMRNIDLMELIETYPDERACREVLENIRWPNGISCPRCEAKGKDIRTSYTRDQYDCALCGYQFSVTSGTMLHDTHLPLRKWMITTYLIVQSKKGISANQVKRTIGVCYKTAWYLCHRIRAAMREAYPIPLKGIVEVDETWVGGRVRGKGHGYKGNKAVVVGAVERDGKIVLKVAEDRTRKTLHGFIAETTAPDTEAIMTDDWPAYDGIADRDTRHETVNHSIEEYVRGDVHTNTIESVWSLLKRSIIGSYHKVSLKHLDAYLDELEWRFNNRDNPWLFRDTLHQLLTTDNLPYQKLTDD